MSEGTLPVDNEDQGASRAQGEGDGLGGDEVGSVEPTAPASGSGLVVDPYSPSGRRLLPSLGVDEGVMDDLGEVPRGVHAGPSSPRVELETPPSEVGTSPPARVSSITQGRISNVDGVRYYLPPLPPPPLPSMVRPTFESGQLPFERSGSGSQLGIHSGGAQEFYSPGFGEGYLNEVSGVNPLFKIDEEVEPPEGAIPLEESDLPVFIGISPDSQAVQEGLGATEPARTTTVAVTEVLSADEPSPDSSGVETSRPIRRELRGFVDPVNRFSRPSHV